MDSQLDAAKRLAEHILSMDMVTTKGQYARRLARQILGITEEDDSVIPVSTNGTMRLIHKDEPLFLLRAQDKIAADTVRFWAERAAETGSPSDIVHRAYAHAEAMACWAHKKTAGT